MSLPAGFLSAKKMTSGTGHRQVALSRIIGLQGSSGCCSTKSTDHTFTPRIPSVRSSFLIGPQRSSRVFCAVFIAALSSLLVSRCCSQRVSLCFAADCFLTRRKSIITRHQNVNSSTFTRDMAPALVPLFPNLSHAHSHARTVSAFVSASC
jgi:hypothetical protein